MGRFVSAHMPWNTISKLELWWLYAASGNKLMLPSSSTLINICCREWSLTLDAIKEQLQSRNNVSLALDRWTSTDKLAITSVFAYFIDRNWALQVVQLTFDEVGSLFYSYVTSYSRMIGQGSTYWRKASQTIEGSSSSFGVFWRLFTWNYDW